MRAPRGGSKDLKDKRNPEWARLRMGPPRELREIKGPPLGESLHMARGGGPSCIIELQKPSNLMKSERSINSNKTIEVHIETIRYCNRPNLRDNKGGSRNATVFGGISMPLLRTIL